MKVVNYHETGRFGRIIKHLRKQGFEKEMEDILYDSENFIKLNKIAQTKYIETVVSRMIDCIGKEHTEKVLFECGAQCCGKSWSEFARHIWHCSDSIDDFFENLNEEEKKYNTTFFYNSEKKSIIVERITCICGLINKGNHFESTIDFCKCSIGHMYIFFNSVFSVKSIHHEKSIYAGADKCRWRIQI
jgi:hypothetical protein